MYPIRIFYIGSTEYILVTLDSPLIINSFHIFLHATFSEWFEFLNKICIGYVLKSADVLTLVSRRYSENSSNTHTRRHSCTSSDFHTQSCTPAHTPHTRTHKHTPTHTCIHPCTCMHNHIHPRTCIYTCTHLCTPVHTCANLCTPVHTYAHLCTPMHTRTHPRIPHTYPLMVLT